jgi:hypothetical protein
MTLSNNSGNNQENLKSLCCNNGLLEYKQQNYVCCITNKYIFPHNKIT